MVYLTLGILIGMVIEKYIFAYFDVIYEKFTYRQSVICTNYKLQSETLAKEFQLKYGDGQEIQAIGFQAPDAFDIDEDEDCKDKKIGF